MTGVALHHFDHQTLTAVLDTLIQERLNLLDRLVIHTLSERKLAVDFLEMLPQELAAFCKRFVQKGLLRGIMSIFATSSQKRRAHLSIKVEEVKAEEAYANLDVFDLDVLAFALTQLLER